jgi:hypothetical protein
MSFDQGLRMMLRERAEGVAAAPVVPDRTVRRVRVRKALMAGGVAVAVAAVAVAGAFMRSAIWTDAAPVPPADETRQKFEQMAIIRQVVDSVRDRDEAALASFFTDDGTFSPYVKWGTPPLAEVIPTWMENAEAWGLDAVIRSCKPHTGSRIECDVRTRWHTLQMEMAERWTFSFEGRHLESLVMTRSNPDPTDRLLPLGYSDLDSWESWLKETHPVKAAALGLLPDEEERRSDDREDCPQVPDCSYLFAMLLRYDPTQAEEIGASIQEYLDSR